MYVKLNASSSQARGNFGGEHIRIAARNIDIIAGIQNERSHYLIESLDLLHFVQKDIVFPVVRKTRDYFVVKNLGRRLCEKMRNPQGLWSQSLHPDYVALLPALCF